MRQENYDKRMFAEEKNDRGHLGVGNGIESVLKADCMTGLAPFVSMMGPCLVWHKTPPLSVSLCVTDRDHAGHGSFRGDSLSIFSRGILLGN